MGAMNSAKSYAILLLNMLNSAKLFQAVEQPGEHIAPAAHVGPPAMVCRMRLRPADHIRFAVRPIAEAPAADY
jgi:hypothetical protein